MAFPYTQAFPGALTIGSIAPGWVNARSGAFTVQSAGFGEVSPVTPHAAVYTGGGTLTDQELTFTGPIYWNSMSGTARSIFNIFLRTNATSLTGISVQFIPDGTKPQFVLYDVGAGFTQIGAPLVVAPTASAAPSTITYSVIGNRVGITFNGTIYYPQDWICPSGYTSGYAGIYYNTGGSPAGNAVLTQVVIDSTPSPVPTTQLTEVTPIPLIGATGTYDGVTAAGTGPFNWIYDPITSLFVCPIFLNDDPIIYGYFYTSPDLVTFTKVAGSLMTPQGSDDIIENVSCIRVPSSGFGAASGKYLLSGLHYSSTAPVFVTSTWVSATLTGFQAAGPTDNICPVGAVGSGDHNGQADQSCVLNPVTNKIEFWYTGLETSFPIPLDRSIMMFDTPDLATYTRRGIFLTGQAFDGQGSDLGAPSIFYGIGPDGSANARWLLYDGSSVDGYRINYLAWAKQASAGVWGAFTKLGPCNYARIANAYENVTVFGGCIVGNIDRHDGNGPQFYVNYNGQNSQVTSYPINAAIGLGYFPACQLINAHYASTFIV